MRISKQRIIRLALVSVIVAACGGAPAPTPAPTPEPTASPPIAAPTSTPAPAPTPNPTPAPTPTPSSSPDVAAAFIAIVSDPGVTGHLTISETLTFGTITGTGSGEGVFRGTDNQGTFTLIAAGSARTEDSIRLGAQVWERRPPGPWVKRDDPRSASNTVFGWLQGLPAVEDRGPETRNGRMLHHLVPPESASIPLAAAIVLDAEKAKDPKATADFYVADDGTPVLMTVSAKWSSESSGVLVPVTALFEIAFDGIVPR